MPPMFCWSKPAFLIAPFSREISFLSSSFSLSNFSSFAFNSSVRSWAPTPSSSIILTTRQSRMTTIREATSSMIPRSATSVMKPAMTMKASKQWNQELKYLRMSVYAIWMRWDQDWLPAKCPDRGNKFNDEEAWEHQTDRAKYLQGQVPIRSLPTLLTFEQIKNEVYRYQLIAQLTPGLLTSNHAKNIKRHQRKNRVMPSFRRKKLRSLLFRISHAPWITSEGMRMPMLDVQGRKSSLPGSQKWLFFQRAAHTSDTC